MSICGLISNDSPLLSGLNLQASDLTKINVLINSATAIIEAYCRRDFKAATFNELATVNLDGSILLKNPPLAGFVYVADHTEELLKIKNPDVPFANITTRYDENGSLTLDLLTSDGVAVGFNTITEQDVPTISDLVDAINLLGGWVATAATGQGSALTGQILQDIALEAGKGVEVSIPGWQQCTSPVRMDRKAGILYTMIKPQSLCRIAYQGGYTTIPDDLQFVCSELVKELWNDRGNVISESLGGYSYSLASQALDRMPTSYKKILGNYRHRIV